MTGNIINLSSCKNCKFSFTEKGEMTCRRHPPVPHPIMGMTEQGPGLVGKVSFFPVTLPGWKCGEYVRTVIVHQEITLRPTTQDATPA